MSETKKYIGITIGPIFDVMNLVSTPAALWATSYMFSMVSKEACRALKEKGYKIISPFFDSADNELFNKNDGIGLFHDRIIIEAEEKDIEVIKEIKKDVLAKVGEAFEVGDELQKRVLFIAVEIEVEKGENPILKGGKILDSLELSRKVIFEENGNPILKNFTGIAYGEKDVDGKNEAIKKIARTGLGLEMDKWPLIVPGDKKNKYKIKSLPDIAESVANSGMKKHNYYAIVRSDGDNISKIIEKLDLKKTDNTEKQDGVTELTLTDFSKACLEYCSGVANLVQMYKGVPIYSSGDDLLAIMPCDSGDKGTVFNFVEDVNDKFEETFGAFIKMIEKFNNAQTNEAEKVKIPSLSFGVSMCYKNFPLYEALADSANLLFYIAKEKADKNCTAVRLQKHSGQSEGLVIYNDALADFMSLHNAVLGIESKENATSVSDDIIMSALYKTEQFEKLFLEATDEEQIKNLFDNTFDAPEHKNNSFLHEQLPEFYGKVRKRSSGEKEKRIIALSGDDGFEKDKNDITVFNFVMRMLKFFVEKGKSNEDKNEGGRQNGADI